MSKTVGRLGRWVLLGLVGVLGAALVRGELADVYLKSGVRLRGEVTVSAAEVVVRNALGEVRFAKEQVERIVPVGGAATQPSTQPATQPSTQPATEPATRPSTQPVEEPGAVPAGPEELPMPPLLSPLDIQRLKMLELRLDGPPEEVRVQYVSSGDRRELPREVLRELVGREDYQRRWEDVLLRGALEEKLQLIVATTGAKYADRINIVNDPEVFATFRTRVLPLVARGCARSGCHGGPKAEVFRLPVGARRTAAQAYTTFYLLDAMETHDGPLLDRDDPAGSVLLTYMLPEKNNPRPHPPVAGKRRVTPVLRDRRVPIYEVLVECIDSLRTPHPDYGLEYILPERPERQPAAGSEAEEPGSLPAGQRPPQP